jgi:hypothetical protein
MKNNNFCYIVFINSMSGSAEPLFKIPYSVGLPVLKNREYLCEFLAECNNSKRYLR